jgi:hypothetical protein
VLGKAIIETPLLGANLQGEMHGGGPPQLKCLIFQEVSKKYGASIGAA